METPTTDPTGGTPSPPAEATTPPAEPAPPVEATPPPVDTTPTPPTGPGGQGASQVGGTVESTVSAAVDATSEQATP